jgi:high-affinity Fe2+/Pb2+ permease
MKKTLLLFSAIVEIPVGIVLLVAPAWLAAILLGAPLDTSAGLVMARLAGIAVLSLGVACGFGSRDAQSRAATGVVVALLFYNVAVIVLLLSSRCCDSMTGSGLLPASAFHTALAVWCIACLRAGCRPKD